MNLQSVHITSHMPHDALKSTNISGSAPGLRSASVLGVYKEAAPRPHHRRPRPARHRARPGAEEDARRGERRPLRHHQAGGRGARQGSLCVCRRPGLQVFAGDCGKPEDRLAGALFRAPLRRRGEQRPLSGQGQYRGSPQRDRAQQTMWGCLQTKLSA